MQWQTNGEKMSRNNKNRPYYDKYLKLWPYQDKCKGLHKYGQKIMMPDNTYHVKCENCDWLKYEIEFKAEESLNARIEKIKNMRKIENNHISLFHF